MTGVEAVKLGDHREFSVPYQPGPDCRISNYISFTLILACLSNIAIVPQAAGGLEMSAARLKHFGWGREGEGLTAEEEAFVIARAEARFGTALKESTSAPRLEDIKLEAPRVTAPASLPFCTNEHYDRAAHTYGKSYPELARGLARDYASAPDVVAYPRNEADVKAVLDWAGGADATVTPFGGGSSVCGGVEPKRNGHKGAVTIDLRQMDKVKEVDKTSRAALIEGGTYAGPSPDRMMIGSEGILGIITQAWMRLQDRPKFRDGGAVRFKDFFSAARAVRAISQAGLYPSNCRI